jgi:hypothetical protein
MVNMQNAHIPIFMQLFSATGQISRATRGERHANLLLDTLYHQTAHFESAWQTTEPFTEWLGWLRGQRDEGNPVWLILDCYSVHRQETIRAHAEELGIHLLFIPPGLTDELQPLDRFVFGVMKGTCRRLDRLHRECDPAAATNQQIAAAFLIRAWEGVSTRVLEDAWSLYEHEDDG